MEKEGGRGWGKTGVGGIEGRGELQRRGGGREERRAAHVVKLPYTGAQQKVAARGNVCRPSPLTYF